MLERSDSMLPTTKVSFLASTSLFAQLDDTTLQYLAEAIEEVSLLEDDLLMHQGGWSDSLYVVCQGQVRVMTHDDSGQKVVLGDLGCGESVGELAMLTGDICMETVYALCDTQLLRLSQTAFDRLMQRYPESRPPVEQALRQRLQQAHLTYALYVQHVFAPLEASILPDLEAELELVTASSGSVLIEQDMSSDALFMVLTGWLRVVAQHRDGTEKVVAEIGRGQSVGEMGLLTGEARNATVHVVRDALLAKLSQAGFERLLQKHPQAITRQFTSHAVNVLLREARGFPAPTSRAKTIAIVALDRDVPLAMFTRHLARAMARLDKTLHLTTARVEQLLGRAGVAQTQQADLDNVLLVPWLNEQEMRYPYVLYEADEVYRPDASPWTRRCLRQADHIVWVGWANSAPVPIGHDRNPITEIPSQSLVLLHPETCTRPTGTSRWLDALSVEWHAHVRWNHEKDVHHLARRLTGRAIGLVLGSGAARGIAHLGVLQAIEDLGLEIDVLGGTSIGAVIGAYYALDADYASLYEQGQKLFSPKSLLDYTLPFASFFSGKKITSVLKTLFEDRCIEDAWRPFFCISTNLTQNTEVVHRRGLLWEALRASSSMPLGLPPLNQRGQLFVDGGLLNPFPADVMQQFCTGGPVIGVDVSQSQQMAEVDGFGPSLSGWHILWNRLNPLQKKIEAPSIWTTMMRSMELAGLHRYFQHLELVDVLIKPPVSQFGMRELAIFDELVELGYQAARPQLEAWMKAQAKPSATS